MIRILIFTDKTGEWKQNICSCLNVLREHKIPDGYHIENPLFTVDIVSDATSFRKFHRYSHIILDKPVCQDFEKCIIRPLISNPVIHTQRFSPISPL